MKRIFKYEVPVDNQVHEIELPTGQPILHVDCPDGYGAVYLWAVFDPDLGVTKRRFQVVGTGQPLPDGGTPIASALAQPFVWHLIELPS
jgi:hypothetical protein